MKPQSKPLMRGYEHSKLSSSVNCRDMQGQLFAVIWHPQTPYHIGCVVPIKGKRYIVTGMCIVNKRLNVNFEEVKINDS